jgi:hypothetical protein
MKKPRVPALAGGAKLDFFSRNALSMRPRELMRWVPPS